MRDIRICFAGDSLTAGTGDETALGWVGRVVAAGIASGLDLTGYNLGVRGATSVQVVRRLAIEARPRLTVGEPRVVLSFGVNDTHPDNLLPVEDAVGALRDAQHRLDPVPILLVGPTAVDDDEQNLRIAALDAALGQEAADLGIPFVSVFAATEASDAWRHPMHAGDGFHPDAAGYALMAESVTPPILAWLRSRRAEGSAVDRPNRLESMPDAPSEITVADVQHLAGLARIALEPGEIEHLAGELNQIVHSVRMVQAVATPDVPATSHPLPLVNVLREDVPGDVLTQAQVLSGAPDQQDGRFRVPAILGEEQ